MVYCVAFNCKNGSSKNQSKAEKVGFFSFPAKNPLRQAWVDKVKRKDWNPSKRSKLCSAHFEACCFVQNPGVLKSLGWRPTRLRLKKDAIPTIFDYSRSKVGDKRKPEATRNAYAKRRKLEVKSCSQAVFNVIIVHYFKKTHIQFR